MTHFPNAATIAQTDLHRLPRLDNQRLRVREEARARAGRAPEFAEARAVKLGPQHSGSWSEDGQQLVWRQRISSPGAHSLNLGFSAFSLPVGSQLFLYTPSGENIQGPFTPADNKPHDTFWSPLLSGDEIVVEVRLPYRDSASLRLEISTVNHDFIGLNSVMEENCNLDLICSAEDGWPLVDRYRHLAQSVGFFTVNGTSYCSGFLVNNGAQDCSPYFVTAAHCKLNEERAQSMVVYWNYQNSFCRQPNSEENTRVGNGILNVFNTGGRLLMSYDQSDAALVRLDDPIPDEANAYFAGWSAEQNILTDTVIAIHHPRSKEKRISFSFERVYLGRWSSGSDPKANGDHLIVPRWSIGTTQDGSSGAPLFDRQGRVLGQLHGGTAACGNDGYDSFGWFRTSFYGGRQNDNSLQPWLDPYGEGIKQLNGRWAGQCNKTIISQQQTRVICEGEALRHVVGVSEAFNGAVRLEVIDKPEGLRVDVEQAVLLPGKETKLIIQIQSDLKGNSHAVKLRAADSEGEAFYTLTVKTNKKPTPFELLSPEHKAFDQSIDLRLQWEKSAGSRSYSLEVARDAAFEQMVEQRTVYDTTYLLRQLSYDQQYYWKVTAQNDCSSTFASGQFHTQPDTRISILSHPTVQCQAEPISLLVRLGSGYEGPVQLKVETLPRVATNWTFSMSPDSLQAGATVLIRQADGLDFPPGRYTLYLTAAGAKRSNVISTTFNLKGAPLPPIPEAPEDASVQVRHDIFFSWSATTSAQEFTMEIARDSNFTDLINTASIKSNAYMTKALKDNGHYYWRVLAGNECGTQASPVYTFDVQKSSLGQLQETLLAFEPNPTADYFNIHLSESLQNGKIRLFDSTGRLLLTEIIPAEQTFIQLKLSEFPNGIYIVQVHERQSSISRRIVVQH